MKLAKIIFLQFLLVALFFGMGSGDDDLAGKFIASTTTTATAIIIIIITIIIIIIIQIKHAHGRTFA